VSNTSTHELRINNFIKESIVDGFGVRMVIFTQGCHLRCPFCHNPATHDLEAGTFIKLDELREIWQKNPLLQGITVSGGEPFLQPKALLELIKIAKRDGLHVLIYTGYLYDDLISLDDTIINNILTISDILIDGPYIDNKRDVKLLYRGSLNQRIIELRKVINHKGVTKMDSDFK